MNRVKKKKMPRTGDSLCDWIFRHLVFILNKNKPALKILFKKD